MINSHLDCLCSPIIVMGEAKEKCPLGSPSSVRVNIDQCLDTSCWPGTTGQTLANTLDKTLDKAL